MAPALLAAGLLALCAASGCAGGVRPGADGDGPIRRGPDLERPIVGGSQEGLELRVWAVENQDDLIAELLERYRGRPTPMPDSQRTAWRASGLWPIAVPIDELTLARGRMKLIGPEQQDWLGLMPAWREAVPGRRLEEGALLAQPGGVMRLPGGRLRLLARCWSVPTDSGPAMQVEMAVQLQSIQGRASPVGLVLDGERPAQEQGRVIAGMSSEFLLQPGEALVLVPVGPGFDPGRVLAGGERTEPGPPAPAVPTVGEAMLTSVEMGGVVPVHRRAIVVLIARLPARFRLLSVGPHRLWALFDGSRPDSLSCH